MKQDDWIKDLQERMADHQESVTDDLWAGIEKTLDQRSVVKKTASVVPWRRYVAAAAVVLVLLGSGSYLLFNQQEQSLPHIASTTNHNKELNSHSSLTEKPVVAKTGKPVKEMIAHVQRLVKQTVGLSAMENKELAIASEGVTNRQNVSSERSTLDADIPVGQTEKEPAAPAEKTEKQLGTTEKNQTQRTVTKPVERPAAFANRRSNSSSRHSQVSMNLYASNSIGQYSGTNALRMSDVMINRSYMGQSNPSLFYASAKPLYLADTHEETDHHQPVSFGLTTNYAFNNRWSVTSGVVYTKLTSDFTQVLSEHRLTRRQTLHYVGIPVNVNYMIWGNQNLRTYVTAGGQADVNVSANTEKEGVDYDTKKDKVQFSTQAALGVQYNITPQLGAYIEPGMKYYIDNGSETQNFFKDKQLNFNVQVGVRWNIK